MKLHNVNYDLRQPGQQYELLWARLRQLGAVRPLMSTWLVPSVMTASQLRDDLVRFVDSDDILLVTEVSDVAAIRIEKPVWDQIMAWWQLRAA